MIKSQLATLLISILDRHPDQEVRKKLYHIGNYFNESSIRSLTSEEWFSLFNNAGKPTFGFKNFKILNLNRTRFFQMKSLQEYKWWVYYEKYEKVLKLLRKQMSSVRIISAKILLKKKSLELVKYPVVTCLRVQKKNTMGAWWYLYLRWFLRCIEWTFRNPQGINLVVTMRSLWVFFKK